MCSISDLKCEGVGAPLQVRIIRKWKNDIRRYETWYLAVDRFGDAIQILGQRTGQAYIESVFKLFDCYTISEYSCPELDRHQKVLENDFYIEVGLISVIKQLPDTMTIPKHWFRFVTKSHLMELGEKPPYYPDFIGVLSKIKDCRKQDDEPYVFLLLTDTGTLRHGSSPATHVYINPEIPETTALLDMYDVFLIYNHQIS
ncbi:unnamed protein product [Lactuca virosa]|uniref:Uncharacterized protein n=1 Tax=Lactuca virosa TaxID=75947 RepID=A0AAU9PHZ1_9ASTR|nr:unnamed protein product [Lactuca virosa]